MNKDLKSKMNGNGAVTKKKQNGGITSILRGEGFKKQIQMALPKHINTERFVRIALTQIKQNPELTKCTPESLLGALMQSAQLGLEPGQLGQAYLIPYKNKGVPEVQFQLGYKGMIELARRSGQIEVIDAHEVCDNDEFEYEYGFDEKLKHKPALSDRGNVYAYYAFAKLKDGGRAFVVMSREDIIAHKNKYSKASSKYSPWATEFDEMAKKTAIKKLMKYLPISVELLKQTNSDEKVVKKYEDQDDVITENVFDYDEDENNEEPEQHKKKSDSEEEIVDEESGEIVEEKSENEGVTAKQIFGDK